MSEYILVDRQPPVATITINRPRQRNAINFAMWSEMSRLLLELDSERDTRAVVITGAGDEAFSAGADIQDFEQYRSNSTRGREYNRAVDGLLATLADLETPTISMIRGFAAGGGCEIAVATDLRIAAKGSKLGKGNALYILLSGRLLDAQEALRIGLVNQVVPAEELSSYTYRLAEEIAALAPLSHAVNKRTMNQVLAKPSLADLTSQEADLPLTQFDTRDYQEGYRAFLEKRRPRFIGE
jgi:enoyl-CoA hydratase/carnithine racemase